MDKDYTLKEVIESASNCISRVSKHPAILRDAIAKKDEELMETDEDDGDLLEQVQKANQFIAEIDDCIKIIYKTVKFNYSVRFPEFPQIADPMQYIMTVQVLGNKPSKINDESVKNQLGEFLDPKVQLLITMAAASTQGVKLEPEIMNDLMKVCSMAIHLYFTSRMKLLKFVEQNMAVIAPNISNLVGAPIAAKLLALAGGLRQLALMPSCNVAILGALNRVSTRELDAPPRAGVIYDCELIQQIPFDSTKDLRKRAMRWIANKSVLAARCDASQSSKDGEVGRMFRGKIENTVNKELEPPPSKAFRPLPAPIEKSGKKRGGKRVRRVKERYQQTELRKAANRMNFGDVGDDAYQDDLGFGRSQLSAIQKLRGPQVNEKTRIRLSKGTQKKLAQSNEDTATTSKAASGGGITFSTEGLQIFNPKAADNTGVGGESNYFSSSAGFSKVKKE